MSRVKGDRELRLTITENAEEHRKTAESILGRAERGSGGDGIPAELFKILKDFKVLKHC